MGSSSKDRTLVLVGKVGCGKSAIGNSLLGRQAFVSEQGLTLVTKSCQKESIQLRDHVVTVIDTPGMYAPSVVSQDIGNERKEIRDLTKDGIHAVILVVSVPSRISEEEESTLDWLKQFYGEGIVDYLLIVFTGENPSKKDKNLPYHLMKLPEPLKTVMRECKNRYLLFDNKIKEEDKKREQLDNLLDIVDTHIMEPKKGKPYSDIPRSKKFENRLERLNKDLDKARDKLKEAGEENRKLREEAEKNAKEQKEILEKAEKEAKEHKVEQKKVVVEAEKLKTKLQKAENDLKNANEEIDELKECRCTIL